MDLGAYPATWSNQTPNTDSSSRKVRSSDSTRRRSGGVLASMLRGSFGDVAPAAAGALSASGAHDRFVGGQKRPGKVTDTSVSVL
jgi:hypothetical protein